MGVFDWFSTEPDTIQLPLQDTRNFYASLRTSFKDRVAWIEGVLDKNGTTLPVKVYAQYAQDLARLRELDRVIREQLENPKRELDREKILRILNGLAKLVGAVV